MRFGRRKSKTAPTTQAAISNVLNELDAEGADGLPLEVVGTNGESQIAFEEGSVDALRRFERKQIVDRSSLDF